MDNTNLKRTRRLFEEVSARIPTLAELIALPDETLFRRVESVSSWSVAQQAHHAIVATAFMLVAVDRICKQAEPAVASGRITVSGRFVLTTGRIPRGRGNAPTRSLPPDELTRDDLDRSLTKLRMAAAREQARLSEASEATWRVLHPVFGHLDVNQWLRLAAIHADHHLAIIRDIRSA